AGDVVARLSDRAHRADLAKTDARLRETRAHVRMLEAGPTADSIGLARTALEQASTRLQYARARLSRNRQLADSGVLTRVDLESSEEQAATAAQDELEARRRLEALLHGSRVEEVEAASADAGPPSGEGVSAAGAGRAPRTIRVTTEIDNDSLLLKPGMSGQAKVFGDRLRILDIVFRRLALTLGVNLWSWW